MKISSPEYVKYLRSFIQISFSFQTLADNCNQLLLIVITCLGSGEIPMAEKIFVAAGKSCQTVDTF